MAFLLNYLRCPNKECDEESLEICKPREFSVEQALMCRHCRREYPMIGGVPIMFPDYERCNFTVNKRQQEEYLAKVNETNQKCIFEDRENYRNLKNEALDSMTWEYFFWENWERSGKEMGFIEFARTKIDEVLKNDKDRGGHLRFFELVEKDQKDLNAKVVLNIGCGRDFLFELFRDKGAVVIEQDIVLDSVLALAKRGAIGICCDIRDLPIKNSSLDIVTSFGVYHHVWPIETPLSETYRVIKNGGAIYLNEPSVFAMSHIAKNIIPKFLIRSVKKMIAKERLIETSPSPYEKSINPFWLRSFFMQKYKLNNLEISLPRGINGNIPQSMKGFANLLLNIAPFFSSHFETVIKKPELEERCAIS